MLTNELPRTLLGPRDEDEALLHLVGRLVGRDDDVRLHGVRAPNLDPRPLLLVERSSISDYEAGSFQRLLKSKPDGRGGIAELHSHPTSGLQNSEILAETGFQEISV